MTYFEVIKRAQHILESADIGDAANDARLLLEHLLQVNRTWYLLHMRDQMSSEQEASYMELIEKRRRHVPLQHLTGTQDFMGLTFHVNEHTLVPRQDTETLVEQARSYMHAGVRVLDMCTGSGCILISLLYGQAESSGTGSDISAEALKVAAQNAGEIGVKADFVISDLFTDIEGKYDIIVSNPPYIPTGVIAGLMPEVRDHEPYAALDGKEDGLYFYRRITAEAREHLKEGGALLYEIGYDQGDDVSAMLISAGFVNVRVVKDLAGNDRVVQGELPAPAREEKEYV